MEVSLSGAEVCIFSFSTKMITSLTSHVCPKNAPWKKKHAAKPRMCCYISQTPINHKYASLYFMPVCMLICSLLVHQKDDLLYIGLEEIVKMSDMEPVTEWAVAYWILSLPYYLWWSLLCVWSSCMERHELLVVSFVFIVFDPASASGRLLKYSLYCNMVWYRSEVVPWL